MVGFQAPKATTGTYDGPNDFIDYRYVFRTTDVNDFLAFFTTRDIGDGAVYEQDQLACVLFNRGTAEWEGTVTVLDGKRAELELSGLGWEKSVNLSKLGFRIIDVSYDRNITRVKFSVGQDYPMDGILVAELLQSDPVVKGAEFAWVSRRTGGITFLYAGPDKIKQELRPLDFLQLEEPVGLEFGQIESNGWCIEHQVHEGASVTIVSNRRDLRLGLAVVNVNMKGLTNRYSTTIVQSADSEGWKVLVPIRDGIGYLKVGGAHDGSTFNLRKESLQFEGVIPLKPLILEKKP